MTSILYRLGSIESRLNEIQNNGITNGNNYSQDIQELFQEIARLEGLIEGLSTTVTNNSTAITNLQTALKSLRDDLTALQNSVNNLPSAPAFRIHGFNDPFVYYSHGMRVFSVMVDIHETNTNGLIFIIHNYNMPGLSPHTFLRGRTGNLEGPFSPMMEFGEFTTPIAIGSYRRHSNLRGTHSYLWLGTAVGTNSMIPFAKFKVN
ncbi:MAG: hypothetical protein FWC02_01665 [Firmicutes bacterium]|nr:hypothetical protein [Bacillota bacterium]